MKLPHRTLNPYRSVAGACMLARCGPLAACAPKPPADRVRVSGQVEATDVQVAAPVGGRLLELRVAEGDRVKAGDVDRDARRRRRRAGARARARRARSGRRAAPAAAGRRAARRHPPGRGAARRRASERRRRAGRARRSAQADVDRFEALLASNSGSRKQRDDAVTRRDVAQGAAARRAGSGPRRAREPLRACAPARAARKSRPRARASPPPTRRSRPTRRRSPTPPSWRRSAASSPRSWRTSAS